MNAVSGRALSRHVRSVTGVHFGCLHLLLPSTHEVLRRTRVCEAQEGSPTLLEQ